MFFSCLFEVASVEGPCSMMKTVFVGSKSTGKGLYVRFRSMKRSWKGSGWKLRRSRLRTRLFVDVRSEEVPMLFVIGLI